MLAAAEDQREGRSGQIIAIIKHGKMTLNVEIYGTDHLYIYLLVKDLNYIKICY